MRKDLLPGGSGEASSSSGSSSSSIRASNGTNGLATLLTSPFDDLSILPPSCQVVARASHHPYFADMIVVGKNQGLGSLIDSADLEGQLEDHGHAKHHLQEVENVRMDKFVIFCPYLHTGFNGEWRPKTGPLRWRLFSFSSCSFFFLLDDCSSWNHLSGKDFCPDCSVSVTICKF